MGKPVINVADVELLPRPAAFAATGPAAERFDARMGMIGPKVGAQKLGYNITEVPPGRRAFPFHNHRVNEEMFFILEGSGEVRIGSEAHPIRVGDVIACPPGGKETAHQIVNTGSAPLRYLAVSTKLSPDIAEYPDSGKFGVLAEFGMSADGKPETFRFVGRRGNEVGYWEGRMSRMKYTNMLAIMMMAVVFSPWAHAQNAPAADTGPPLKTTFVRLTNNANALIVEPVTPIAGKSRIALVVTHPDRNNNFSYFTGQELAKYGYRALMINYYGPEQTWDEFIAPVAAAIRTLRALPGVEKVVLVGHSSGGTEMTAYQDVAENGVKACQDPERVYKCNPKDADNLPKFDGVLLPDSYGGAIDRTMALNPAIDLRHPRQPDPKLDMFNIANGYNPATKRANYSAEFRKRYFAAQAARANRIIDEAQARLKKIENDEGDYKDDEPLVVPGADLIVSGARLDLVDTGLLSKTHAAHTLLKADGSTPVQIIPLIPAQTARATPEQQERLAGTTMNTTVRHYLAVEALRLTPDFALTADNITGVRWRSTPSSLPGNLEGIRAPTLVMAASCSEEMVTSEIAYDHSAAKDKEFVGVEGATHLFRPCKPEYGDTFKRAFDYMDGWLSKPGRF
jgi:uncharacterized cupin superfamily protein/pimeloyl-ACP methyl ester carboxylesterase